MSVEWGTVGEWMSGVPAAIVLGFAFVIHASRKERSEQEERRLAAENERREAMARAIGVTGIPQRVERSVYDDEDPPPDEERWEPSITAANTRSTK